ncbi:MAG: MBG domain-containing protein, partial [Verrucomicrobiota bacterium]
NAGSYTVIGTINSANYQGGSTNTLVVSAFSATVTLGNLSQTYNGAARTVSASAVPAGLSLNVTYNGSPTAPVNVGSYTVVAVVSSPNYTGGATNTLVVGKASQTINLALEVTNSIPLNQFTNPIAVTATASSGLPVTLTLDAGSAATLTESNTLVNVRQSGTITLRANQAGTSNYTAAAEEAVVLDVTKVGQTLQFAAVADQVATNAPVTLSATASSGLAVQYTVVSGPATVSGNQLTLTGAGVVTVAADQPGNANYNAAETVNQRFNVTLASQAITFGALSARTYGNGSFPLSATASSGLAVSYSSSDSAVASVSGNTVTLTGPGTATLTASQAGNAYYEAAANVSQPLLVNAGSAAVVLGNLIQGYDGTVRSVTATPTPAGLAVSVTYDGWPAAPKNAGRYTVVATITDAHYTGSATDTLVISQAPATVTLGSLTQTHNGAARSVTTATAPVVLPADVTYDGSASAPTNAGRYTVIGTINSVNYAGGSTNTLVVSASSATVTLGNLSQTYNGAARTASASTI